MKKQKSRIIALLSGKGGVGKTTSAVSIGTALNYFNKSVIIVDANITTPNLGLHFGVPIVPVSFHDVLRGKKDIKDAIYQHRSGTKIIPGSIAFQDLKRVDPLKMERVLKDIDGLFEFIILDGAAGLGKEAYAAIKVADEVIVVTNPEMPAVTDALKTIKYCQELKKPVLGILVAKTNARNADMSLKDIEELLETNIISVVPEDHAVKFALAKKDSVIHTHPDSAASIQFKKLAAELAGIDYEAKLPKTTPPSLIDAILKWMNLKE